MLIFYHVIEYYSIILISHSFLDFKLIEDSLLVPPILFFSRLDMTCLTEGKPSTNADGMDEWLVVTYHIV